MTKEELDKIRTAAAETAELLATIERCDRLLGLMAGENPSKVVVDIEYITDMDDEESIRIVRVGLASLKEKAEAKLDAIYAKPKAKPETFNSKTVFHDSVLATSVAGDEEEEIDGEVRTFTKGPPYHDIDHELMACRKCKKTGPLAGPEAKLFMVDLCPNG